MPWLSVFGNHDGLVQGNVPSSPLIAQIATGSTKIIDLPPGVNIGELAGQLVTNDPQGLQTLFGGPSRQVTADPNRRPLSRAETIAEYFNSTGQPHGHGYTAWNLATRNAYYTFGKGRVRGIALDTVNPFGGAEGSIDEAQLAWLTEKLKKGSRHYLDESGHVVRGGKHDRLFVIFSHHTIGTMDNNDGPGRVLGPAVRDLLLRFPNVVLWVNGHTHRNTVTPYARKRHAKVPGASGRSTPQRTSTGRSRPAPSSSSTTATARCRSSARSSTTSAPTSYGKHPKSPWSWPRSPASWVPTTGRRTTGRSRPGRAPRTDRRPQRRAAGARALRPQPPVVPVFHHADALVDLVTDPGFTFAPP